MDDLLREFLAETHGSLDMVDVELVRFEQDPNNAKILDNIFRLVHTIKGTCGFLGLPRLEALAHAAETLMGKFRDGMEVTGDAVTLILSTIDRIKELLGELERTEHEPGGSDQDLIGGLARAVVARASAEISPAVARPPASGAEALASQVPKHELRARNVSFEDLERAFRRVTGPEPAPSAAPQPSGSHPPAGPERGERAGTDNAKGETLDSKVAGQSIRVNVDALEKLMTLVSELVLTRNQLLEIVRRHEQSQFKVPLQRLSNITAELQERVMKTRMQPVGNIFQKMPRIVRDLSIELGKEIELEMHGADTELDRQVLDLIKDPLTHMVRNSADHGLETPVERKATGKPEKGTIRLSASHQGGNVIIEISDDGRGLDTEKIKANAIANGLAPESEVEKLSEAQIHRFIYAPGFSTAPEVTSVSGRGVGMDVVRANVDQIGGRIDVKSVLGRGSSFTITIPLTLAIISALIVDAAGDRFAIPQLSVVELVRARRNSEHRIERIRDASVLRLRNKLLPLVHLKKLLGLDEGGSEPEDGFIVVTQVDSQSFGIVVDGVFDTEEIVVKPMSTKLRHIPMFSGNTILGDGSVVMILDPNGIAQTLGTSAPGDVRDALPSPPAVGTKDTSRQSAPASKAMSLLVFRAGSPQLKAVPLSLVTRLEEVDCNKIELSNGRRLVQYRGRLMPLVQVNDAVRIRTDGTQPLVVFSDGDRWMGLVVDEIVDIVEDALEIEVASATGGTLGTAIVRGQATEIIDVGHFLPLAFEDWFRRQEMRTQALTRSLLFVDDSAFFRNMLGPVLKAAGFDVTTAEGGEEALELIRQGGSFDVIVSDIDMPRMNGFELAESVRRDPRSAQVPIIALSAVTAPATIERGRQAGFHDFVAKFDRTGLIAVLKETTNNWVEAA